MAGTEHLLLCQARLETFALHKLDHLLEL